MKKQQLRAVSTKLHRDTERVSIAVANYLTADNRRMILGDTLDSLAREGNGEAIANAAIWSDAMVVFWFALLGGGIMDMDDMDLEGYDIGYDFTAAVVEKYVATDKDYASLRKMRERNAKSRPVSPEFLANFIQDTTPLGRRCDETFFSSPFICQRIAELYADRQPLDMLRDSFVGAIEQVLEIGEPSEKYREPTDFIQKVFEQICDS